MLSIAHIIVIGLAYLLLPALFPVIYSYFCAKYIKGFDCCEAIDDTKHFVFSWVIPLVCMISLWILAGFDWNVVGMFCYVAVEFVLSFILLLYLADSTQKNFEVRNRYYQQKLEFGLDINDLDIGQLVLTTKDTKRDHNRTLLVS